MTKPDWLTRYRNDQKRPVRFSTVSDMEIEPLYMAEDTSLDAERIGVPGEFAKAWRCRAWSTCGPSSRGFASIR